MLWLYVIGNEEAASVTCCQRMQLTQEASGVGKAVLLSELSQPFSMTM